MKFRKIGLIAAGLVLSAGLAGVAGVSGEAHASSGPQICTGVLLDSCENAWNGGPSIKSYTNGAANNQVNVQTLGRCDPQGTTTTNCPIQGNPAGLAVYQVQYVGPGAYHDYCIGSDSNGNATLVGCNNGTGYGGGPGTIQVAYHGSCGSGYNYGVNSHWSSSWSNRAYIFWNPTGTGQPVIFGSSATCLYYS